MTASDIMPVLINVTQSVITSMANYEVFDGISVLTAEIGLSAFAIICGLIIWLRGQGGEIQGGGGTTRDLYPSRISYMRPSRFRRRR